MEDFFDKLQAVISKDFTKYSNSEVITPKNIVKDMVDLLPAEIFKPEAKFLDPAVKSGRFLAEIYRRLMDSPLLSHMDEQSRRRHILENQLYGLATSGTAATIVRKQLYDDPTIAGNIVYIDRYLTLMADKGTDFRKLIEKEFGQMKFDVVIGNPPYQDTNGGGNGAGATSLYEKFIEKALDLCPAYISMITKSSWFNGLGYAKFRERFVTGNHLQTIVDYTNSVDVFDNMDGIAGGVSYFLWSRKYNGKCCLINHNRDKISEADVDLSLYGIVIRYPQLATIIEKVNGKEEQSMSSVVSSQTPFGFTTNAIDSASVIETNDCKIKLIGSHGREGWVSDSEITKNSQIVGKYKALINQAMSGGCKMDENGMTQVLSKPFLIKPNEICTQTYLVAGVSTDERIIENELTYLKTKFVRALMLATLASKSINPSTFQFVPLQDFSHPWTDQMLYDKYGLSPEEIEYIENTIKPME